MRGAVAELPLEDARKEKPVRESDYILEDFAAAFPGQKYKYRGAIDAEAWKRMKAVADLDEIRARWRFALREKGWLRVSTLAQLDAKWNDIGTAMAGSAAPVSEVLFDCCGKVFDAEKMGRFKFAQTDTFLCADCYDERMEKCCPGWTQLVRAEVERSAA